MVLIYVIEECLLLLQSFPLSGLLLCASLLSFNLQGTLDRDPSMLRVLQFLFGEQIPVFNFRNRFFQL